MTDPKLYEIRLPAGDIPGFDIGGKGENGARRYNPVDWLSKGYAGVRFIGHGPAQTHLRPAPGVWNNLWVVQHPGIVQLEELTLHNGGRTAMQFGTGLYTAGLKLFPQFGLRTKGVVLDCNVRGMWGVFSYEADIWHEDYEVYGAMLSEHPGYHHGHAKLGILYNNFVIHDAGAEAIKLRPDSAEVRPVKGGKLIVTNGEIRNWYQPWSNRGGAGIVVQGGNVDIQLERLSLYGGDGVRCRCIMIDDGEGKGFTTDGFPNGHITIKNVAAQGRSTRTDYGDTLLRVGPLGSSKYVARSLTIDACSLWGENMAVQLSGLPAGQLTVKGSNTPALRDWANAHGFDTTFEAQIPAPMRRIPISEGIKIAAT